MPRTGYFQCRVCYRKTAMMTVKAAAAMVGVSDRAIYSWVKQKKVHVVRTVGGQFRICQHSLFFSAEPEAERAAIMPADVRIKLAVRILDKEYSRTDPTLDKLSKQLGISMWYFGRLFKKNTGVGFREYIKALRMKKAAEMLSSTLLSVKEISISVGYKYVSDFDHHFKSVYGVQPSEYRRAQLALSESGRTQPPDE